MIDRYHDTKPANFQLRWVVHFERPPLTTAAHQRRTSKACNVGMLRAQGLFRSTNLASHTKTVDENGMQNNVSVDRAAPTPKLVLQKDSTFGKSCIQSLEDDSTSNLPRDHFQHNLSIGAEYVVDWI